ncbi:MAG: hypothetical protein GXP56_12020 [Deltaproteobacteria bacterium]|nr:hypothetical protein [Deltaproteobacteria bacterium]
MIPNPTLLEMLVKERRHAFEEEAEMVRLLKLARSGRQGRQFKTIEKIADLLISFGEYLKKKYCKETSISMDSSFGLSKDSCRC